VLTERERYRLWFGGIAGASFVAMTQLLTREQLNIAHKIALACFALTLPASVAFLLWPAKHATESPPPKIREFFRSTGALLTMVFIVAIGALFWSFNVVLGVVFVGSCVAVIIAMRVLDATTKRSVESSFQPLSMEISDDLVLAKPIPNGWSWTLASRLGELIQLAEKEFGSRDQTYTPLGFEFSTDGPRVWYPGNRRHVLIQINSAQAKDLPQACYQLAQECVHLLSPTGDSNANYLEEGVSIVFATKYIKDQFHFDMIPANAKYAEAAKLTDQLLALDPDLVRKVRAIQPSFSQITAANILKECPSCPPDLADRLLRPF